MILVEGHFSLPLSHSFSLVPLSFSLHSNTIAFIICMSTCFWLDFVSNFSHLTRTHAETLLPPFEREKQKGKTLTIPSQR